MESVTCPNPQCQYEIPVEVWKGSAVVVCPKCAGIFQKSQPVSVAPPQPLLVDVVPRESRRWVTLTIAGMLGAGAAVVSGAMLTQFWQRPSARTHEPFRSTERNFSFVVPGQPWQSVQDLRDRDFIVSINMRRSDPESRFVLALRPTQSGYPAPGVVHADAIRFLRHVVGFEHIEIESRPATELAGASARRFVFSAVLGAESESGDVYAVEHQGTIYWLFRWCATARLAAAQPGLDELRDRIQFLNERPNWKSEAKQFQSESGEISLIGDDAVWQRSTFAPSRYDSKAVLVLESKPAGAAQVVMLVLPLDGATSRDRARSYFLERQKAEDPDAIVTELNMESPPLSFRVERRPGQGRWFGQYVVEHAGTAIVGQCECALDQRPAWEPEFSRLMATLKWLKR